MLCSARLCAVVCCRQRGGVSGAAERSEKTAHLLSSLPMQLLTASRGGAAHSAVLATRRRTETGDEGPSTSVLALSVHCPALCPRHLQIDRNASTAADTMRIPAVRRLHILRQSATLRVALHARLKSTAGAPWAYKARCHISHPTLRTPPPVLAASRLQRPSSPFTNSVPDG